MEITPEVIKNASDYVRKLNLEINGEDKDFEPLVIKAIEYAEKEKVRTGFTSKLQAARVDMLVGVFEEFTRKPWFTMDDASRFVCNDAEFLCDHYGWSIEGRNVNELIDTGLNFAGNLVGDYAEGGIQ